MSETATGPGGEAREGEGVSVLSVDPRAHLDTELLERQVPEARELERRRDEDGGDARSLGTTNAVSRSNDEPPTPSE